MGNNDLHTKGKTMTTHNANNLGSFAAEVAMKAAAEYIRTNNLKVVDYAAATSCIRDWCKIKLPEALADAKQALESNMGQAAEATFKLTMVQAGIEAAKEFGFPADYQAS